MVMTMDYEKKYKAALEWMQVYGGLHGKTKEEAEHFFPELKESEDERIRKEIMQLIQCMHDADPRKGRWLSWLEKQQTMNIEEMLDLLRMEYSKGRYDTISKAVEWLNDNFCEWPNEPKRVEGFFDTLEEMKKDFIKAMEG